MLKWSSSLSVSSSFWMVLTVIIRRLPFMLPLVSTSITMFLGELAALMYLSKYNTLNDRSHSFTVSNKVSTQEL